MSLGDRNFAFCPLHFAFPCNFAQKLKNILIHMVIDFLVFFSYNVDVWVSCGSPTNKIQEENPNGHKICYYRVR